MLTKRYPPISNMFEDVIGLNNRLWSSFDHLLGMAPPIPVSLNPSVEMNEDGGKIKYLIDMPGVSISEASVVQEGNYIKVEAERAHRNTKSHFLTNFKVSPLAKMETLEASMKDGVLTLSFDARAREELNPTPKRIEIKASEKSESNTVGLTENAGTEGIPDQHYIPSHGS